MIEQFTKAWFARLENIKKQFAQKHPNDYADIVKIVVQALYDELISGNYEGYNRYKSPDPERIHVIDDGDYQGTLVFIIGAAGSQPDKYWVTTVSYGSCSACDTFESIRAMNRLRSNVPPTEEQVEHYTTLALHILQHMKQIR